MGGKIRLGGILLIKPIVETPSYTTGEITVKGGRKAPQFQARTYLIGTFALLVVSGAEIVVRVFVRCIEARMDLEIHG
jgi:TRAP-type mannitol/chloroaromatic compound transport system permease small subunit